MTKLIHALSDWKTDAFASTLRAEIMNLETGILPLEKGVFQGGYIDDSNIEVTVLGAADDEKHVHAHVGIFFTEIVACCGCGDEPMAQNAYCEVEVSINKTNAKAVFSVKSG